MDAARHSESFRGLYKLCPQHRRTGLHVRSRRPQQPGPIILRRGCLRGHRLPDMRLPHYHHRRHRIPLRAPRRHPYLLSIGNPFSSKLKDHHLRGASRVSGVLDGGVSRPLVYVEWSLGGPTFSLGESDLAEPRGSRKATG